jgi:squalene synthase HpnC
MTLHAPGAPIGPSAASDSLTRAYAECGRLARAHYENFPVASRLLPGPMRPHVAAVYAFARHADDFADEARFEGQDRLALLDAWGRRLRACAERPDEHPVFLALGHTIRTFGLPLAPFEDLLDAFRMDVTVKRYAAFEDLLGYCRRSADPVGRIVLLLFGHREARLHALSDAVCTGLQLANFWQDVGIDLDKGRCYIPVQDMMEFGVSEADLAARRATPAFSGLMRFQVERTRAFFARGAPLAGLVGGRLGFELRLVAAGGSRILDKIDAAGGDVFSRRPVLTAADWGRLLLLAAGPAAARGPDR